MTDQDPKSGVTDTPDTSQEAAEPQLTLRQRTPKSGAEAKSGVDQSSETDEVAQLRAQIAELNARLAAAPTAASTLPARRRNGWWRPWVAGVLIAVAALIAFLSVVAMWAHDEVSDTDRYVETVGPLASDPAVQNAIIDRISNEIFSRLDVTAVTQQAVDALAAQGLPPQVATSLNALATPLASGVRSFVTERISRFVKSPEFEQAWIQANREAHTQLVAVLTGEGSDTINVSGNTVSVNLATVIETVKARLANAGFNLAARIPTVNAQFTIFESADLAKAQTGFRLLKAGSTGLPILGLLFLAIAVYIARDRRRMLMVSGLAIAASMLLLGTTLNVFRPIYLDAIPADQLPRDAAASIYDTLTQFIRLHLRAVLVVSLAVAAGAWLSGSSAAAVATRRGLSGAIGAVRGGGEHLGLSTGPVGAFAYTYRTALRAVVIGIALLVYVQTAHPTGAFAAKVLGITVVVLLLVELLARPPAAGELPATVEASTSGPATPA